jgi:hypothetical protein
MIPTKERMKAKALRENKDSPSHRLEYESNKAQKQVRKGEKFVPKHRDPRIVPPRVVEFTGTYDGAELRPFDDRPGAMDFKKYPSKGLST